MLAHEAISQAVIGSAMEVHRALGPGLLESAYQMCLAAEFEHRGIEFVREVPIPVTYRGRHLDCGYRADFVVADVLVLELKAIEKLLPIHEAQLLTCLRLTNKQVGLLINFHVPLLKDGIVRRVL